MLGVILFARAATSRIIRRAGLFGILWGLVGVAPKSVVVLATSRLGFDSRAHKGVSSRLGDGPRLGNDHFLIAFGHIKRSRHELVAVETLR